MAKTYTIDELLKLPDGDLNTLAAELRGWYIGGLLGKEEIDVWCTGEKSPHDNYERQIRITDWTPVTCRNQSGELIIWALDRDVEFVNTRTDDLPMQSIINARAETIAFCAAMLAIQETK